MFYSLIEFTWQNPDNVFECEV